MKTINIMTRNTEIEIGDSYDCEKCNKDGLFVNAIIIDKAETASGRIKFQYSYQIKSKTDGTIGEEIFTDWTTPYTKGNVVG